ncbi:hypothetical protein [Sphingomonas sp. SRS2]|uniref:hypothetical protein n=1 Tax=Sphingomonas sp. SRS2 TaxID=133190 RepID=UPI0006184D82|nr:hypothetical protein [Sphingomonas sp. SRS2]KKC24882.1 hypothetical protein WP12_16780 [Sphingomonas sp. SRS2]
MKPSPEIAAAVAWLTAEADAVKSGAGLDVPAGELAFAAQRLRACAAGLEAGLHLPDALEAAHG